MRHLALTSTTAIALAFGHSAPLPVLAQAGAASLPVCTDVSELPCAVPDLDVIVSSEADRQVLALCGQIGNADGVKFGTGETPNEASGAAQGDDASLQHAEQCSDARIAKLLSGLTPIGTAADTAAQQNAGIAEEASELAEDTARTAQSEVDAARAEADVLAAAEDEAQAAAEEPAAAEAEALADVDDPVEPEAAMEAGGEAAPEEPVSEADAEAVADTVDRPGAAADVRAEAVAPDVEAEAVPDMEVSEDARTGPSDQAVDTQAQDAADLADALETGQAGDQPAQQSAPADTGAQDQAPVAQDPAEQAQAQAEAAAEVDAQTSQAAAANDAAEAVSSEDVTLTEENTRSSDEAFDTGVGGDAQAAATAEDAAAGNTASPGASDDDSDLVRALKAAAAVGLGAYAIGQTLDDGGTVVSNSGDRVVVERDGRYRIIKDDDALLRRPGSEVRIQTFEDGSTRNTVTAEDGTRTVTIRAADGRVLRRTRVFPDGERVVLFDDTRSVEAVDIQQLRDTRGGDYEYTDVTADELRAAILAAEQDTPTRRFSLNQVRFVDAVRHQVPVIALDAINFETGSAVIQPREAEALAALGNAMRDAIEENPRQVFLIEGHTDTVGAASYNLALSDRRAESVALALTEYFDVPPANMIVQGYGESDLKVRRAGDIRANRRAAVRNITGLLNDT